MNSNEQIYEIASIVGDNKLFKGDMSQAAGMIKSMLSEKYITPIKNAMENENKRSRKNPNKEARLLEALKPFMPESNHQKLNDTIDVIHFMETMRGMQNMLPQKIAQPVKALEAKVADPSAHKVADPSVHEDGVYDIDQMCLTSPKSNIVPIFMAMIMMNMTKL